MLPALLVSLALAFERLAFAKTSQIFCAAEQSVWLPLELLTTPEKARLRAPGCGVGSRYASPWLAAAADSETSSGGFLGLGAPRWRG